LPSNLPTIRYSLFIAQENGSPQAGTEQVWWRKN